jgi:glycosyltransferase involved in cell wall biosynthesis
MKILWVKSDFLHPTERGGQIRTLQMLKQLHRRHEIHYAALKLADQPGGVERSPEYCSKSYPVPHHVPVRPEMRFWWQVGASMFSRLPLPVSHHRSEGLRRQVAGLIQRERFDAVVCDFLSASLNVPDLAGTVLFQHNVEAQIWERRLEHATFLPAREYLRSQYQKMRRYEGEVCRAVKRVIAVSSQDAQTMRSEYGVRCVQAVPTGVDLEYFTPPAHRNRKASMVFVGAMDWTPNVDGVQWFVTEVLPRIHMRRPDCELIVAGRRPDPAIHRLARTHPGVLVTGTVPDVRPYLWEAAVSIVPLRIGGGTRLKIFEAMAAKVPVVSTTIGAEGLDVRGGETIRIADTPQDFAEQCLELLDQPAAARSIASAAWELVSSCYSWEVVSQHFERLLV